MKLIIGLGNPPGKYDETRHNVGFEVIDAVCAKLGTQPKAALNAQKRCYQSSSFKFQEIDLQVAKPTLYMNESGRALTQMVADFEVEPADCLIIIDDVELPIGTIRIRSGGSAGGHNGLESVLEALKTKQVPRLRVGIGKPDKGDVDLADYVLGAFSAEEREQVSPQIIRARDAALAWASIDIEKVMQEFNVS